MSKSKKKASAGARAGKQQWTIKISTPSISRARLYNFTPAGLAAVRAALPDVSALDEVAVMTELPTPAQMRELLAKAQAEYQWRIRLFTAGRPTGWKDGESAENAYLLDELLRLIRGLEKKLAELETVQ